YPPNPNPDYYQVFIPDREDTSCKGLADGRRAGSCTTRWIYITDAEHLRRLNSGQGTMRQLVDGGKWYLYVSKPCNYPPEPTETDVNCADTVTIEGFGPMSDPSARTFKSETRYSDWS